MTCRPANRHCSQQLLSTHHNLHKLVLLKIYYQENCNLLEIITVTNLTSALDVL